MHGRTVAARIAGGKDGSIGAIIPEIGGQFT
jgi:hypothetical protein